MFNPFLSIPIVVSETTPLRSWKRIPSDDYESVMVEDDCLCMQVGGVIYVHPDRMWWFEQLPKSEQARVVDR